MGKWNTNTVPQCKEKEFSDEVLVTVKKYQRTRVMKAIYVPYHHCTSEDVACNVAIFEEETPDGDFWIPEGWYEVCDYAEDYMYFPIEDEILAWKKLPKVYEGKLTDLSLVNTK